MSKFGGVLKRIKNFANKKNDKNKFRIYNDPKVIDPSYNLRQRFIK